MCGCAHARVCLGPYQLRRAFKHFDRDYSGSITVHEFTHVMRNFGYPSSHYQYPSSHDFSRYSPYRYPYSRDLYHYSQNHCARHALIFLGGGGGVWPARPLAQRFTGLSLLFFGFAQVRPLFVVIAVAAAAGVGEGLLQPRRRISP